MSEEVLEQKSTEDSTITASPSSEPEVPPVTTEPLPPQPKVFRKVIELKDKDGKVEGGVQVFTGSTEQELIDKLAEAQVQATRKIRELALARKLEVSGLKPPEGAELEPDIPPAKPRELTADERFTLAEKMKNPETVVEGYRELHKATTGRTPEEDAAAKAKSEHEATLAATRAAAQAFMEAHPEYFSSVDNGKVMGQYLAAHRMSTTSVSNYEIAFRELSADGLLDTAPVEEPEPLPPAPPAVKPETVKKEEPRIEAAPTVKARTAFPSGLSRDQASGTGAVKPKKPSAAEIAMMNADQYKAYLEGQGLWGK